MILPPFLKPGDKVGVISTSNYTEQPYIDQLVQILKDWQLVPVLGRSIGARHGSFAGSDTLRKDDLQEMLDNDQLKAVLETMGGYGIVRVIEQVNFNKFKYGPKWLVGYSDTTFLHSHVQGMLGIASIHATMAADLEAGYQAQSWETLRKALFGESLTYQVKPHALNREGISEATMVGGTISVLCNAKGTMTEVNTNGKILFLEEVGEKHFRLDSYLMSLKQAGKFEYVKGLVVGDLVDIQEDEPPFGKTPEEIVWDAVKEYDFPVCFGFPAGHGQVNKALIFGAPVKLKVSPKGASLAFKL
ncbi:S66 peptidase family protein [Rufibacter quisquiliarum]|uniref:Muramoyltetrapeptide carboxypeptidase n=1 Tax=Rufibacter quisquiliarum TaxID=1549639 RepID=A0A839GCB5_9BACT|nr:LD-carboxypeptidase [Rufibacter quisquiliarum]MBA9077224.1 muramoyltetrapeptide carboxypeptidase [Rufibacter quisquiliarum]